MATKKDNFCVICQETKNSGRLVGDKNCGGLHGFCVPCIKTWKSQNPTCPVCRAFIGEVHEFTTIKSQVKEAKGDTGRVARHKYFDVAYTPTSSMELTLPVYGPPTLHTAAEQVLTSVAYIPVDYTFVCTGLTPPAQTRRDIFGQLVSQRIANLPVDCWDLDDTDTSDDDSLDIGPDVDEAESSGDEYFQCEEM
jgi:hypothetical protein